MDRRSTAEEAQGLSGDDDLCDHHLKTVYGDLDSSRLAAPLSREDEGRDYFLESPYGWRFGVAAPLPLLETIFSSRFPGAIQPGIFFELNSDTPRAASQDEPLKRQRFFRPTDPDQSHDSEIGDIYDLYNACNGVMRGDLLDVRKLDELSAEETEVLDVPRLREVWEHTRTGCLKCEYIIQTLNLSRGATRTHPGDSSSEKIPVLKAKHAETY